MNTNDPSDATDPEEDAKQQQQSRDDAPPHRGEKSNQGGRQGTPALGEAMNNEQ